MISRPTRYERWDGSQEPFGRDAEELFDRLAEDLCQGGDFDYALHRLMSRGWRDRQGKRLPGYEEMLERLRNRRQQQLKRYNLNDVFGNIRERLNDILRRERQGIQDRLGQAPDAARRVLEKIARKKQEELDRLPEDVGGTIRALNDYEFMDEGAAQAFQQLMEELKRQVSQTYFRNMTQTMQQLQPEHLGEIKQMLKALNQMLRDRLEGRTPDFDGFMRRFGQFFGSNPPRTLDELIQQLEEALGLMERLQSIEDLEHALREGYQGSQLTGQQAQQLQELLGSDARQAADQMSELAAQLERKGYVQRGRRGMELTPRGMRR